ncbi:MAG: hypothetical protein E7427_07680 [Ruminococcaceae bacterium]|nr:hypothetical protein [Oscillospiraceae bacterium]
MKKQPEKKNSKVLWVVCLVAVLAITAVRVICHFAGVEMSDAVSRGFGIAELIAVAAMVYTYMKWRQG